jgi:hypothetical protein
MTNTHSEYRTIIEWFRASPYRPLAALVSAMLYISMISALAVRYHFRATGQWPPDTRLEYALIETLAQMGLLLPVALVATACLVYIESVFDIKVLTDE